ncbi:MAG: hypothetical protein JWR51_2561 [Devosia sp.]|uniref:Gfo/Idh/MocA family protein n=1 Tax=Devosia sp. TaxID=1871048 RepID=UPI0026397690|nr:Gfo/Idh/MocA family oxidoreductase [Devosia sp.]MDB5529458.1 hypothetical protein [Devosia sp.]
MVKIAVLGAAHAHVDYVLGELRRDDRRDFTLVGIQDADLAVAQRYAADFGVPAVECVEDLLSKNPDVVVIAGIYGSHGRDVVAALRVGAHVLADKPLCTSLEELDAIADAAAEARRTVSVMFEKRGYPETLAAAAVVNSGELGEIVGVAGSGPHKLNRDQRPAWFFQRAQYGGILADLSVHDFDAALQFAPADTGMVQGAVSGLLEGAEDFPRYGVATLVTPRTIITCEVSWLTPQASDVHGDYRLRLVGTEGSAEIFWARGRVEVTTHKRGTRVLDLPPGRRPAQDALDAFAQGVTPPVDTAQSLTATRLALLAQASADENGRPHRWTRANSTNSEIARGKHP